MANLLDFERRVSAERKALIAASLLHRTLRTALHLQLSATQGQNHRTQQHNCNMSATAGAPKRQASTRRGRELCRAVVPVETGVVAACHASICRQLAVAHAANLLLHASTTTNTSRDCSDSQSHTSANEGARAQRRAAACAQRHAPQDAHDLPQSRHRLTSSCCDDSV